MASIYPIQLAVDEVEDSFERIARLKKAEMGSSKRRH
jgi:hypothetical protein